MGDLLEVRGQTQQLLPPLNLWAFVGRFHVCIVSVTGPHTCVLLTLMTLHKVANQKVDKVGQNRNQVNLQRSIYSDLLVSVMSQFQKSPPTLEQCHKPGTEHSEREPRVCGRVRG